MLMRVPKRLAWVVGFALAASLVVTGQDFAVQPAPMDIVSSPAAPDTQSFDQPVNEGLSPRNASYTIDARLDPATRTIAGREILSWRNISRRPATELRFHLYWNAFRNADSTWMREQRLAGTPRAPRSDAWGSIDITLIRLLPSNGAPATNGTPQDQPDLTSGMRFLAPDDDNQDDRTVMAVALPAPIAPNQVVELEIEWTATVPRTFHRTGYVGDFFFMGQWFPKIGVLEDAGWNAHQFHRVSEFYADFGVYDLRLRVPQGWVVGASGREVGTEVHTDGTVTHHFRAEDVHDVAWTTSPDFIDVRKRFTHPTLPSVDMRLLIQPEHQDQADRHFAATAAALKYYGEWFGAYPYGYVTIVDTAYQSRASGMEYPTLFTAGTRWLTPERGSSPDAVIIHEAGHQWWYGMVASNEFEHAWMDEGINTFAEARAHEASGLPQFRTLRAFGRFIPWVLDDLALTRVDDGDGLARYRQSPKSDAQATPTFRYWLGTATPITYFKTSLWLHTLERHLGWPTVRMILSTYFERWKFRHPAPQDFFNVASEVSGQDLTWFFDEVYRSSNAFDYRLQALSSERRNDRYHTTVVAERLGEAVFPVEVVTTFRDGTQATERWGGRERRRIFKYDRDAQALEAQVDPRRVLLLDVNYTNNSRTLEPRSTRASLKWALTWMVWLQDLMLTYGFFA